MSSSDFQSTEVMVPGGDVVPSEASVPLGVGDFEDHVTHDPLAGSESKRRIDTGSLLIFGVVIVSVGGLVAMRALAGDDGPAVGSSPADEKISKWIDQQRTTTQSDNVVALFPEEYLENQVPLANVQKNPFIIFDRKEDPEDVKTDPLVDAQAVYERERQARLEVLELAGTRVRIQSVLMSSTPLANVNDKIVRIGESLVIKPEEITFRVTAIRDDGLTLVAEDLDYELKYELDVPLRKQ